MNIVLDTHILVFVANDTLTANRKQLLKRADSKILFSSISLWEMAKLIQLGKLKPVESAESYLTKFVNHPRFTQIQMTPTILRQMIEVAPQMHRDPADQIIVATALAEDAVLMSDDGAIKKSKIVKMI